MALFNDDTLKELSEGLKSLGEKFKDGLSGLTNKDNTSTNKLERCPNCGAQLLLTTNTRTVKCEYCATEIKNPNYTFSFFERDDDNEDDD